MKTKFLTIVWCVGLTLALARCSKELPILGQWPNFQLQDQNGQRVSPQSFQGKVLAVNFVFTSCAGTCPLLTERMKKVQHFIETTQDKEKKNPFHIISISVDPERDTPQRLQEYMKSYELNPEIWSFLTGPYQDVEKAVVQGFKISMGKVPPENAETPAYDVIHGEKFIVVDKVGKIRGYFDATETGLYQLTQAMAKLAKR